MANMKLTKTIVAGVLFAGLAGAVFAQQSADEVIAKRRTAMSAIGSASGGIRIVANSGNMTPEQAPAVKDAAGKLVAAVDVVKDPALWPKGSGVGEVAGGTKAKAEIWTDSATFKTQMDAMVAAGHALKASVDAGDVAKMKTDAAELQKTCGGCHSKFRT